MSWLYSVRVSKVIHMNVPLSRAYFVWLVSFIPLVGCSDELPLKNVKGSVSYQGTLLDHGSLRFFGENGRPIGSAIQSDGSYEIDLLPGEYQVSVSSPPVPPPDHQEGDPLPPDPRQIPARYSQPNSSGLSMIVGPESEDQSYVFELE